MDSVGYIFKYPINTWEAGCRESLNEDIWEGWEKGKARGREMHLMTHIIYILIPIN